MATNTCRHTRAHALASKRWHQNEQTQPAAGNTHCYQRGRAYCGQIVPTNTRQPVHHGYWVASSTPLCRPKSPLARIQLQSNVHCPQRFERFILSSSRSNVISRVTSDTPPARTAHEGGKKGLENSAKSNRKLHVDGTHLMAALLEAETNLKTGKGGSGAKAVAKERINELTPEFFSIADAYMGLAKKEGNLEVIAQLENAMKIAWEVKNDTLRGELKLLNQLINAKKASDRTTLLKENVEYLHSDDGFFFKTLDQFTHDVEKKKNKLQRDGERMKMMVKLRTIKKEAKNMSTTDESFDFV